MTQRTTLIQLLRSNTFAVWIAILSVAVQSFHTFFAFYKISSLNGTVWGIAQAVLFAIIVDCAVLFYTVRKNTKVTWMAAFIMVLINLYVYYTHLGLTFDFMLGVLISFVIPVSNYFYSEEIDDERDNVIRIDRANELKLENELKAVKADLQFEKDKATKYITELRGEIKNRDEAINIFQDEKETLYAKLGITNKVTIETEATGHPSLDLISKGFASLKSPAHEDNPPTDKSLLGVEKIIATDRPNP